MFLIVGAGFLGTYLIRQLSAQFRGPILATVRDTASVVPFPKTEYVAFDVTDETDVLVCGGGTGGAPAMIAAGRNGSKVIGIE